MEPSEDMFGVYKSSHRVCRSCVDISAWSVGDVHDPCKRADSDVHDEIPYI